MSKKKSKKKPVSARTFFDKNKARAQSEQMRKAIEATVHPDKKIKLFYHGDSPKVNTGFGIVAREILGRLYQTGKYEIHSLGINDKGDTSSHFEAPGIFHYSVPDYMNDPYGIHKMQGVLPAVNPDVIFTLNDIWVLHGSERNQTKHWFIKTIKQHCPHTPWVLYFPVDSRPWTKEWADLAYSADKTVVYSKYAIDVLKEIYPEKDPVFIPHGVSSDRFKMISDGDRKQVRESMNVADDDFLIGFLSRNQPRKNPSSSVEIFKMANEGYRKCNTCSNIRNLVEPKCEYCGASNDPSECAEFPGVLEGKGLLYLHFNMEDPMGVNMHKIVNDNKAGDRLIVRPNHDIARGVPDGEFTAIINALDCHFLPTTAEGFGLTVIESMACGIPNIATRTTSVTEQLEEGRGMLVHPKQHWIFDDAANTRKYIIDYEKAIHALGEMYRDWKNRGDKRWGPNGSDMVSRGLEFCKEHSWDRIGKEFDKEIINAIESRIRISSLFKSKQDEPKCLFVRSSGSYGDILNTLPAIKRFKEENPEAEVSYAIPSSKVDAFKGRYDWISSFAPMERMTDRSKDPRDQMRISYFDMQGPEQRWEASTHPFIEKTRADIYAMHLSLKSKEFSLTEEDFPLTDAEILAGREKLVGKLGDDPDDHFVVCLVTEATEQRKAWGVGQGNWIKLKEILDKPKVGVRVVTVENTKDFVTDLAMMTHCDLVVTTDNSFLPFLAAHNIKTILMVSPIWAETRSRYHKNCIVVSKQKLFDQGQREPHDPGHSNVFMEAITHGEISAQILAEKMKAPKKEKKELVDATA